MSDESTPRFLSGVFVFEGRGLALPQRLGAALAYAVPAGRRAQIVYLRAGNASPELVCLTLMRDGAPMRLFPVGARAAIHVPLAVMEDLLPDTRLDVFAAGPAGLRAEVVIDLGLIEI